MSAFCYSLAVVVHTLGHSTLSVAEFLALLAEHEIRGVADVRRHPVSRRHPHFTREALAAALAGAGLFYDWLPGLGGRRPVRSDSPHVAWRNASFRGYADHMDGREFSDELARLLTIARARSTAILCAEAVPWRCHRQLVADALVARGIRVRHILGPRTASEHSLTAFARLVGDRVVYDGGQLGLAGAAGVASGPRRDRR
jgi:uncharacterized protein (DUF488 family)